MIVFRFGFHAVVEQHLTVFGDVAEMGVHAADNHGHVVVAVMAFHLDVEFLLNLLLLQDFDAVLGDELLALLHHFGSDIFQYLKLILGFASQCAEGDGDGQSDHAGAGDSHAHGVFQHIRAE